eukprot:1189728-Prymnesium_polylepis.1
MAAESSAAKARVVGAARVVAVAVATGGAAAWTDAGHTVFATRPPWSRSSARLPQRFDIEANAGCSPRIRRHSAEAARGSGRRCGSCTRDAGIARTSQSHIFH